MRLLIYGLNFSPELTGIGKYTGEMAEWLAARGHDVRVITAPPYYPAWSIRADYRRPRFRTEHPATNLTVFRTPLYVPAKPSGLKRMVHLFSFALGSLPALVRQSTWRPDVLWTVEPTFFGAPFALALASACDVPAWLHVQDYEVDAAFDLGLLPAHGPVHTLALALESLFTRHFRVVSSISPRMVERAETKSVPPSHTVLFPNWVDTDAVQPLPHGTLTRFRLDLNLGAKTVLLYSGNMGNKQGLELLAPLAQSLAADPSVHLLFCGDGAFRPQLEALVHTLPNVTLLPLQPVDRLPDLLNTADIHLLPQRAGAADLVMPSKLTGMLSSGRPVLATADPGTMLAHVIQGPNPASSLGRVVPTTDPAALLPAAQQLIADPALRQTLGHNARIYAVQHLSRDSILRRFEQQLFAVAHRQSPTSPAV